VLTGSRRERRGREYIGRGGHALTPRARMTSPRRRLRLALVYAGLAFFLVIALFPIVWMAITAFKDEQD